jgi:glucose/arabinose dehydrogenase
MIPMIASKSLGGWVSMPRALGRACLVVGILAGCADPAMDGQSPDSASAPGQGGMPIDMVSGASAPAASDTGPIRFESAGMRLELEELVRTGGVVWSMGFIGPNTMIFTERSGAIKTLDLDTAAIGGITGGPDVMQTETGGVFGVYVDPEFADNGLLYFTYVKAVDAGSSIALARGRLANGRLVDLVDLFVANNASDDHAHWGSRVVMDSDRYLFMTSGERHVPDNAQDLASHGGKVLRLFDDGSVPPDNPFVGRADAAAEIWSYGHRNPQGLAFHPENGQLFEQEHGPTGGDEINIIEPGRNYGWPVITYGDNIWGGQLPEGTERDGMEQPLKYFRPGIAPSGMSFYFGDRYPGWRGNLFSSTLRGHLNRLVLDGNRAIEEERLIADWRERLRDVVEGPDGYLYIATENGAIARIVPVE